MWHTNINYALGALKLYLTHTYIQGYLHIHMYHVCTQDNAFKSIRSLLETFIKIIRLYTYQAHNDTDMCRYYIYKANNLWSYILKLKKKKKR